MKHSKCFIGVLFYFILFLKKKIIKENMLIMKIGCCIVASNNTLNDHSMKQIV